MRTIRYPFDKFDLKFVKRVFEMYPYLKSPEHLAMVLDKLKKKKYAYYITINGVNSQY